MPLLNYNTTRKEHGSVSLDLICFLLSLSMYFDLYIAKIWQHQLRLITYPVPKNDLVYEGEITKLQDEFRSPGTSIEEVAKLISQIGILYFWRKLLD